jgi:hypothetical protein
MLSVVRGRNYRKLEIIQGGGGKRRLAFLWCEGQANVVCGLCIGLAVLLDHPRLLSGLPIAVHFAPAESP